MDKQSDSENSAPIVAKSAKNGNSKDKGKAPQQQSSPSQPAPAPSKPVVKRKRKRVKDANAPKHPLTGEGITFSFLRFGSYMKLYPQDTFAT